MGEWRLRGDRDADRSRRRAARQRGRPACGLGRARRGVRQRQHGARRGAARRAWSTGVDYVGSLLERAAERAAAERLDAAFAYGDAEELPFADASFDATTSVMGAMFAPDHERAAAELVRVTRPGGTIALASWAPTGFVGAMFWTIAEHVPPPAGLPSPMLWGTPDYLDDLFGADVTWIHRRQTFTFRFASADAFVDRFATSTGRRSPRSTRPAPTATRSRATCASWRSSGTASRTTGRSRCRRPTSSRSA